MTSARWAVTETGDYLLFDPHAPFHTVVAGITRSGKSKGSQSVLIQLAKMPDVQVCGIDPAFSLLRPFWEATGRPQDFVLGTSPAALEAACDLVDDVVDLMETRLMNLGRREKIEDFSADEPLVFVVLEEFAGLVDAMTAWDKKKAAAFQSAVGRLLREGAKIGVRVFTIIQRAEAATLKDRSQYGRRISYAQDNTDSVKMLFDQVERDFSARVMGLTPGRGVIKEIGMPITFFQSPDMSYDDFYTRIEENVFPAHSPIRKENEL